MSLAAAFPMAPPAPPRTGRHGNIPIVLDDDDEIEMLAPPVPPMPPSPEIVVVSHRRRDEEPILVLDSDDEDEPVVVPQAGPSNHRQRYIFSPPPPPQHPAIVPPVPPLPHELWPHRGLTHRNGPPRHLRRQIPAQQPLPAYDPPLYPVDDPALVLNGLPRHARRSPWRELPPVEAAPASHHRPVMGLGGALLATNRLPANEEAAARYHRVQPRYHYQHAPEAAPPPGRHIRHITDRISWNVFRTLANDAAIIFQRMAGSGNLHHHYQHGFGEDGLDGEDGLHGMPPLQPRDPDYKPEYTHPRAPAPGFAHDFAPSGTEPGEKAAPIIIDDDEHREPTVPEEPTLVCARCQGALLMESGATSDDAERRRNRVFALRCGHMFDGRCIEAMMRPVPPPVVDPEPEPKLEEEIVVDRKGKGKAIPQEDSSLDMTGKGKAKAEPEDTHVKAEEGGEEVQPTRRRKRKEGMFDGIKIEQMGEPQLEMRARLRHRTTTSGSVTGLPTAPAQPPRAPTMSVVVEIPRPAKPLPKRKRKGKGSAKKAPTFERFEWTCPVATCSKLHASLKMDGEWVHDPKTGAIALFV